MCRYRQRTCRTCDGGTLRCAPLRALSRSKLAECAVFCQNSLVVVPKTHPVRLDPKILKKYGSILEIGASRDLYGVAQKVPHANGLS